MRLEKIQKVLKEKNFPYTYTEEDGCGSIDFELPIQKKTAAAVLILNTGEWSIMCGNFRIRTSGARRLM